ncbi:SAM-dependent methyltransferase [Nonomuraea sp. NPDC023979]|uniref:SAM-dependent methyltransferase n=1 Tax=Nonomuraea sp. NPDC023979 TaxID=3154796 RepID=UPI0033F3301A
MLITSAPPLWDSVRAMHHLTALDPARPRLERILDAALGGKNNFAADRELALQFITETDSRTALRSMHAVPRFYQRVIRHLVQEGVDQIVVLGTGVPTGLPPGQRLHDIAHARLPTARVVYAESDPLVLAAARATIEPDSDRVRIMEGDVRELSRLFRDPLLSTFLDREAPIGLLIGCLHNLTGDRHLSVPQQLRHTLAPNSRLAIMQITHDHLPLADLIRVKDLCGHLTPIPDLRTLDQLRPMFAGLDLLDPGIVSISQWRPSPAAVSAEPRATGMYGAVARIP